MNNYIKGLFVAILMFTLAACAAGPVENKRAPGMPWEKRYEILVDGEWIEITGSEWDNCGMYEQFPACRDDN